MNLCAKAIDIRKDIITLIHNGGAGHIGGDLSVTDILVNLYYKQMNIDPAHLDDPDRDRFILSKGHSVEALYAVLADKGFFPKSELDTYCKYMSNFIGHPNNKIPGMALAARMDNRSYRTYVVMGDGECGEGSVWEAAMAAGHYKLDNLTAFVDRNRLQISGTTEQVMTQDSAEERWASFGWNVLSIPGNDMQAIDDAIDLAKHTKGKPTVIIANTTKGCGVSFIENQVGWHHKVPNTEQYEAAIKELDERKAQL